MKEKHLVIESLRLIVPMQLTNSFFGEILLKVALKASKVLTRTLLAARIVINTGSKYFLPKPASYKSYHS